MGNLESLYSLNAQPEASLPSRLRLLRFMGRQNWIPRGQDRILRAIWHPDSGKSFPFVVDFFGFRYPGNLAQFLDWTVFAYGCYSWSELSLLAAVTSELRRRKSRIVFFDVGANLGHHTLFMAGQADEIVAFEPFPPLQEKIRHKLELNHLFNVRVVPFGLGDADSTMKYHPGGGSNSGTGTFVPEEVGNYEKAVELRIRQGDRLSSELALPPIDIMKNDVEGFEPAVLRGFRERISRDRPVVLMEVSDRSRNGFKSEEGLRSCFWEGAVLAGVVGRPGRKYRLVPFRFSGPGAVDETLVAPPEMADFINRQLVCAR